MFRTCVHTYVPRPVQLFNRAVDCCCSYTVCYDKFMYICLYQQTAKVSTYDIVQYLKYPKCTTVRTQNTTYVPMFKYLYVQCMCVCVRMFISLFM